MQTLEQVTCPFCGQLNDRSHDLCELDIQDQSRVDVECQHCQKPFSYVAEIRIYAKTKVRVADIDWGIISPEIEALRYIDGEWLAYSAVKIQVGKRVVWKLCAKQLGWPVYSLAEYAIGNPIYGQESDTMLFSHREQQRVLDWMEKNLSLRPKV